MSADSTALSGALQTFWDRMLIERLIPLCVMNQFGIDGQIPAGQGKTISWRKFGSLTPATTPLTEGTPPSGSNKSLSTVTATVAQYGDFLKDTDVLLSQAYDSIMAQNIELLAEQAAQTVDLVTQAVLAAGTNVIYQDGVADRVHVASTNKWTDAYGRLAVRNLERSSVPRFADGFYVGICNADVANDIRANTRWIDAQKYLQTMRLYTGELGMLDGVRYVQTQNAPVFTGLGATGIDVQSVIYLGTRAYGKVKYENMQGQVILKPLGSAGTADPLNQVGTVGWKLSHVAKIIDQARMVRLECAAST